MKRKLFGFSVDSLTKDFLLSLVQGFLVESNIFVGVPPPSLKPRPHSMIYSQQELVHQAAHGPPYAHYPQQHPPLYYRRSQPPLDSSQGHIASHIHWDTSHESLSPPGGSQVVDTRLIIPVEGKDLRSMTGSTPELTVQPQGQVRCK